LSASLSGIGSQVYSYDRYGNLLSKGGSTFCSGTCTNNQIPGASYVRGNLTSYAGQSFSWDGLDRMTSNQSSSLTWSYLYDGAGERLAKIPPTGNWTLTMRDENKRVVSEYSGAATSRDNVFLGEQLVLSYGNAAVGGSGPAWTFYASDHLGTPRLVTDISGSTVETRRYWPYGDSIQTQGTFEALRFATMEFDAEGGTGPGLATDRYYDHARSHVGGLARFVSPDMLAGKPATPQSWNRYSYSYNNPIKYRDPTGLITMTVTACPPGEICAEADVTVIAEPDNRSTRKIDSALSLSWYRELVESERRVRMALPFGMTPIMLSAFSFRRVVVGKMAALERPGSLRLGERTLLPKLKPDLGSAELNWARNERVLLDTMEEGLPIRDASVNPATGELVDTTGFLGRERSVLVGHGWTYDKSYRVWLPPGQMMF